MKKIINNSNQEHFLVVGLASQRHHIQYALDNNLKMSLLIRKEKYKPEYEKLFKNVFQANNIFDFEEIKSFVSDKGITAVLTRFESYIAVVGAVNEHLGLEGIDYKTSRSFGNKYLMKKKWLEAGVPCAAGVCADSPENRDLFLDDYSYPVILKKASGTHSSFVFKVKSEEDLEEKLDIIEKDASSYKISKHIDALEENDGECDLVMEEMLSGIELTVDTFISNGVFTHTPICEYILPEELDVDDSYLPVRSTPTNLSLEVTNKIYKITEQALTALGANNCVCHTEFFYDEKKEKIWVIETTARGGGNRSRIINSTTNSDFDYDASVFKAASGSTVGEFIPNGKTLSVIEYFSPKKGVIKSIDLDFLNDFPGVEIIKIRNKVGDKVNTAQSGGKNIVSIALEETDVGGMRELSIELFSRMRDGIVLE